MNLSFAGEKLHFTDQQASLAPSAVRLDAVIGDNQRSDEWMYYASCVRPQYERMNRLIGQIGGLLILGQANGCFDTYFEMSRTPKEQTEACLDELNAVVAPVGAVPHLNHLRSAARKLDVVAHDLNGAVRDAHRLSARLDEWLAALKSVSAMLHCAADPVVSLQPVAFEDACACCVASLATS
ncbi:hypothetical protein I7860_18835 [Pseudomonas tolaasii]|uniref:hypothetical protein n=1 Tax=Pseudomonas TaxID=286 RepID=UPI0004710852|nr:MULTISPECIES: hypothetical protein [Pseudomonas]MBW1248746.1 hypothetical protein [Pseudomonas tolaasii]